VKNPSLPENLGRKPFQKTPNGLIHAVKVREKPLNNPYF
jgi:hypothetical protein